MKTLLLEPLPLTPLPSCFLGRRVHGHRRVADTHDILAQRSHERPGRPALCPPASCVLCSKACFEILARSGSGVRSEVPCQRRRGQEPRHALDAKAQRQKGALGWRYNSGRVAASSCSSQACSATRRHSRHPQVARRGRPTACLVSG